jgi:5-methylcytosine-specific restriction endonuclease McrA
MRALVCGGRGAGAHMQGFYVLVSANVSVWRMSIRMSTDATAGAGATRRDSRALRALVGRHERARGARPCRRQSPYQQPAWRQLSLLVVQRDGACVQCGSREFLTAHHVIPRGRRTRRSVEFGGAMPDLPRSRDGSGTARTSRQLTTLQKNLVSPCVSGHARPEAERRAKPHAPRRQALAIHRLVSSSRNSAESKSEDDNGHIDESQGDRDAHGSTLGFRTLFGAIPNRLCEAQSAERPANLMALCASCHGRTEATTRTG